MGDNGTVSKAYAVCLEMMAQRTYTVVQQKPRCITAKDNDGELVVAYFVDCEKYRSKTNKEYLMLMHDMGTRHGIIIYSGSVTTATYKEIHHLKDCEVELFALEDLQYNITKHRLQPLFERLTPSASAVFKTMHGTQCAIMRVNDPVARFYHYRAGDIVRVIRGPERYVSYRVVCE